MVPQAAEYACFLRCRARRARPAVAGLARRVGRSCNRGRSVRIRSAVRGQSSARSNELRSALGGEIMPDVPVQSQVRLGLSNETEMVPPGTIVMWATSWMLMVLPSEPVAWAENVNVAFAFC